MKFWLLALLGLFVLASTGTWSHAQDDSEKRTWRLTVENKEARLDYGTDNAEDTPIAFSCTVGRGRIDLWINETEHGVKANRTMTASLTAGSVSAKVRGKTLPNEEAGTPSFQGTQAVDASLFAVLAKEKSLVFVVGPSRDEVPLAEMGDKAEKFSRVCQKKQ